MSGSMLNNLPHPARALRSAARRLDLIKAAQHRQQVGSMSRESSDSGSCAATVKFEILLSLARYLGTDAYELDVICVA